MNNEEKKAYLEKYQEDKKKGLPFFPDILFKDAVASLVIFLILIALAYYIGAPLEERANPADTAYTPRPEWYFLFLFQLLKYFPGNLEVIGVVVIPTLAILLLFALPYIDRSAKRHPINRLAVIGVTFLMGLGVVFLSVQSVQEAPPPAETAQGDQTALLYIKNCAACHGPKIDVPTNVNLYEVIAQGKHEGMPAWSADLTTNEIGALEGFILSPAGSSLFTQYCAACHEAAELVQSPPLELKNSIDQGTAYVKHTDLNISNWNDVMDLQQRSVLLNFLVAPDGQRLFVSNCSICHGSAVIFSGTEQELRTTILEGGRHLEMPAWKSKLSDSELDALAKYVSNPTADAQGAELFEKNCVICHGDRIPQVSDIDQAKEMIASGGSHETMPVWGKILTPEQVDALVSYTIESTRGTSLEVGQALFTQNCSTCHGALGEGGSNPANPNDIIAPISSAEYLKTRDDFTLRSIISQGQPNFGMSPFGTAFGGPLEDNEVDAIVAFIRSWEADPPVEQPPEVARQRLSLGGEDVYLEVCAQCHGVDGAGPVGASLVDKEFQTKYTDQEIFNTINLGHEATSMIGWGEILSADQIQELVKYIRELGSKAAEGPGEAATTPTIPTFVNDVLPIFKDQCVICHGSLGGWDSSTYQAVMTSGNNAPVVIPGDAENSLLAQWILGTHSEGKYMPPGGKMTDSKIQVILDWIAAGAPEQ